jgi:hypothetical protein
MRVCSRIHSTQRRGEGQERRAEGEGAVEVNVVELSEAGWHLFVPDPPPNNWHQPLVEGYGMLNLPCAALGRDGIGRDYEYDGVGALDQPTEPRLPVLAGGDVVLVEIWLEACDLQSRQQVLGKSSSLRE